jgi:hypothetical protein
MVTFFKKNKCTIATILATGTLSLVMLGAEPMAVPTQKILNLIPISYNQGSDEFSVLLTLQERGEFTPFQAFVTSFSGLDDSTTYMPALAPFGFNTYSRRSLPFGANGFSVTDSANEAYMFIEVPYSQEPGSAMERTREACSVWLPLQALMTQPEDRSYGDAYSSFMINKEYLQTLQRTLPSLQQNAALILAAQTEQATKALLLPQFMTEEVLPNSSWTQLPSTTEVAPAQTYQAPEAQFSSQFQQAQRLPQFRTEVVQPALVWTEPVMPQGIFDVTGRQ